ncbi:MAG: major facilitator superfamily transporter permease [Frankiales bacterium]|nr:major facilitator superfamily transporter permease [Frankiales bacterium]
MATYAQVLRRPEMPAILTAHAVSLTGTVAAEVALSVLIYGRTQSPLLSSLTLGCAFVPQAFSAFLLSGFADRFPARRLLVVCDLLCAALVGAMAIPGTPIVVLLALAAVTGVIAPLFSGARSATLADVLDDEHWVRARSMMRVISQSALLLGFAVGGLALAAVGSRTLLVVDALSFVGSALLLRLGTVWRPARATERRRARDGMRATVTAMRFGPLRRLMLMMWLPAACISSVDALATPYASDLHHGPTAIGFLLAAAALGTILAEALGARLDLAHRPHLVVPVAMLCGLGLLVYLTHPPVLVAVAVNLVAALGGAVSQVLDGRLLARLPDDIRGQLLSFQQGLMMGIQGAGIALAGALAEVLPPHAVLALAGAVDLVCVATLLRDPVPEPVAVS